MAAVTLAGCGSGKKAATAERGRYEHHGRLAAACQAQDGTTRSRRHNLGQADGAVEKAKIASHVPTAPRPAPRGPWH